jgi:hypothetical protein
MCKPDDERILVYTVRCIQGPFELHINHKTHRVYVRKISWATADDKKKVEIWTIKKHITNRTRLATKHRIVKIDR